VVIYNYGPPHPPQTTNSVFLFVSILVNMNGNSCCITRDNSSPKQFTARYSRTVLYICFITYQEKRHCRDLTSNKPQYRVSYNVFMSNIIKMGFFIKKLKRMCQIRRVNDIIGRGFCFICFNIIRFLPYKRLLK